MSDFNGLADKLAAQQIAERVAVAERSRAAARRRPHARHTLAVRLHRMADRLDG